MDPVRKHLVCHGPIVCSEPEIITCIHSEVWAAVVRAKIWWHRQILDCVHYCSAGVFHRPRFARVGMKHTRFHQFLCSVGQQEKTDYLHGASFEFLLFRVVSQVNDKLSSLFTCSGSLFLPLWLSKGFWSGFGSEKQRMACSGLPTGSNAGFAVLSPPSLPGGSLSPWSEPLLYWGLDRLDSPSWATHRDLWPASSLQTTEVVAASCFCCSPLATPSWFWYKEGELVAHSGFGWGVWRFQFRSKVPCNASGTSSLSCGPDWNLLVYSQAGRKVLTGLRCPYVIETSCILQLVVMVAL